MSQSEAQKRAKAKYNLKAYERLELKVFKGNKDIIKRFCVDNNISVNGLINQLLYDRLTAAGYELYTEPTASKED